MLNLRLKEIAVWTHGNLQGADTQVCGVSTDSRTLEKGQLFVAIAGERHDGHDHVAAAAARGAAGAIVARRMDVDLPQIVVADTLHALGDLASAVRAQRDVTVIGITGSNGKTSVKTMTARDPRASWQDPRQQRQFQQRDRLAADVAVDAAGCPIRGAGDGRGQARRHRLPRRDRASATSASSTISRRRIWSAWARWRAWPKPRVRCTRRCPPMAWR